MAIPTYWMAYYADRFIKETSQLRPIEHSAYYRLFESYAQTGHLLNDPYMLRSIVKLDSEMTVIQGLTGTLPDYSTWMDFTGSIIDSLLAQFFTLAPDGTYHHPGWDKELDKAKASYDAKVKGAIAANESRRKAERDAKRNAEQHTTNNEERTAVQSSIGSSRTESEEPTNDSSKPNIGEPTTAEPERPADSRSEHPRTRTEHAAVAGSALSGSAISAGTAGQKVQKPSATGPATATPETPAASSAHQGITFRLKDGSLAPLAAVVDQSRLSATQIAALRKRSEMLESSPHLRFGRDMLSYLVNRWVEQAAEAA